MATADLKMTAVPVTSKYGPRKGYTVPHKGVDTANGAAYPHSTFGDGEVIHAGWGTGANAERGLYVQVRHAPGIETSYHSLSSIAVAKGDTVKRGDIVGNAGTTAQRATGRHVHNALWLGGVHVDPLVYLAPGKVVTVTYGSAQPSTARPALVLVDGVWGDQSQMALQRRLGVTVDGIWGDVSEKALQRFLGVADDGVFGPVSIKALQRHLGTTVDGVWGPVTTRRLQERLNAGSF